MKVMVSVVLNGVRRRERERERERERVTTN